MGQIYLAENESHIDPNMCAKFGCSPTVVSKKGGYRQTDRQTGKGTLQLYIVDIYRWILHHYVSYVELSGRMLDSQSREPGFDSSLCYRFAVWEFLFSPRRLSSLGCINQYLAIDSGGNVCE